MNLQEALGFLAVIATVITVTAAAVAYMVRGHERLGAQIGTVDAKVERVADTVDGLERHVLVLDNNLRSHMADESRNLAILESKAADDRAIVAATSSLHESQWHSLQRVLERQGSRIDELFDFLMRSGRPGG